MADFEKKDRETVGADLADLEARLRAGLRRLEAPAGFAERVMDRVEARVGRVDGRGAGPAAGRAVADRAVAVLAAAVLRGWWRGVAAVLVVGVAAAGWMVERERTERMEAREARKQFAVAMRLTARVTERSFAEAQRRISRTPE